MRSLLLVAVSLHVAIVVARVPGSVVLKRLAEIDAYRAAGPVRFHLDNALHQGADGIEWLLANTPEDAVVLFHGERHGALEFVPGLLYPRLMLDFHAVRRGQETALGRPIARGTLPGKGSGRIVVVGHGDRVELEVR